MNRYIRCKRNVADHRSHNPNIPELVNKLLVAKNEPAREAKSVPAKCRCCSHRGPHDEIVEAINAWNTGKDMGYKARKDSDRASKSHGVKRRRISRDPQISYLHKYVDAEGTRITWRCNYRSRYLLCSLIEITAMIERGNPWTLYCSINILRDSWSIVTSMV